MIAEPTCHKRKCKHYEGVKNDGNELSERVYCAAFPDRIPDNIAYGNDPHTEIRPDQSNTIVFEK